MARVTVEDCILKVPNRFDLVLMAAERSRQISAGSALTIERDNDKNPIIALREIAEGNVDPVELQESLIKSRQHYVESDMPADEELMEFLNEEETLKGQFSSLHVQETEFVIDSESGDNEEDPEDDVQGLSDDITGEDK